MASRKLFINYRRDDSRADAGRLYDRLHGRYPGRVFRDVGSLEPGVEWHEAIEKVLGSSDACIVVIGRNWLTVADAAGKRRIDDPRDTCRQEVATALTHGMRVFPVLVGGAKMPAEEDLPADLQPLARRNALELHEQDWDEDVDKLARAIEKSLGWTPKKERSGVSPIAVGIAAAVVLIGAGVVYMQTRQPAPAQLKEALNSGAAAKPDGPPAQPSGPAKADVAPPPPPPVVKTADPVGSWRAVVTAGSDIINERSELYPDSSFRVLLENNNLAAIGRWQSDGAGGILITNAVNFLNRGVKFSCRLRPTGDSGFEGGCSDSTRLSWDVSMSDVRRVSTPPDNLPRINIAGGTMAEKATFVQVLAAEACTCGCGLNVHNCLLNDQTCPLSPGFAQNQWATFLRLTRA
jgi:hypothetical protein